MEQAVMAPEGQIVAAPLAVPVARIGPRVGAAALGSALIVVGALLPWATVHGVGPIDSTWRGIATADGRIVLALGATALLAVAALGMGRSRRIAVAALALSSLAVAGLAIAAAVGADGRYPMLQIDRATARFTSLTGFPFVGVRNRIIEAVLGHTHVSLGVGLVLVIAGATVATAAALLQLRRGSATA